MVGSGQTTLEPSDGVISHQSVGRVRNQSEGVVCSHGVTSDQSEGVVLDQSEGVVATHTPDQSYISAVWQ